MKPEQFADFANSILSTGLMRHNATAEPAEPAAHALAAKVDRLGQLAADAAAIELEAARIRTELEAAGLREILGQNYRANFAQCKGSTRIDWKAISAKFKPSRQLIAAHTTTGREAVRMTITAHPTH
jgi:histidinol-phosphate/aromatic aminotransferase/cobyric acid decarboxylase-like protein